MRLRRIAQRDASQRGGAYTIDQWCFMVKEFIEKNPTTGQKIMFDQYFSQPIEYDPDEKLVLHGEPQRLYDLQAPLRARLHIFNPEDPSIIKDSEAFSTMIAANKDPNDTSIVDSLPFLLDLENTLRTMAGVGPITDKNLANQNHYPLYLWFLAAPTLKAPENGQLPVSLTADEIKALVDRAI
jgi:hypothetical protein